MCGHGGDVNYEWVAIHVPDDWDGGHVGDVGYERDAEHVPDVKHVDPA